MNRLDIFNRLKFHNNPPGHQQIQSMLPDGVALIAYPNDFLPLINNFSAAKFDT